MQKFLIPRKGLIVRDPISKTPLPEEGGLVDWNGNSGRFYRRRVKQGDCTIAKQPEVEVVEEEVTETTSKRRSRK